MAQSVFSTDASSNRQSQSSRIRAEGMNARCIGSARNYHKNPSYRDSSVCALRMNYAQQSLLCWAFPRGVRCGRSAPQVVRVRVRDEVQHRSTRILSVLAKSLDRASAPRSQSCVGRFHACAATHRPFCAIGTDLASPACRCVWGRDDGSADADTL